MLFLLLETTVSFVIAFYSGSFRELFGKIKGFPIPGLAPEGIIFLRKNSGELIPLNLYGIPRNFTVKSTLRDKLHVKFR